MSVPKVTEALTVATIGKAAVGEFVIQSGGTLPTSNTEAGLGVATDYAGGVVASMTVTAAGHIIVAMNASDTNLSGKTLALTATVTGGGGVTWTCGALNATGTPVDAKYRPGSCRTDS